MTFFPGEIIRIEEYQLQHFGGKDKPRWFIFLGKTNPEIHFDNIYYFCSTTTDPHNADLNGNGFLQFHPPPFTSSCYVYFREALHEPSLEYLSQKLNQSSKLKSGEMQLERKGAVTLDQIRNLYLGYWSRRISPKKLRPIKQCIINHWNLNPSALPEPQKF